GSRIIFSPALHSVFHEGASSICFLSVFLSLCVLFALRLDSSFPIQRFTIQRFNASVKTKSADRTFPPFPCRRPCNLTLVRILKRFPPFLQFHQGGIHAGIWPKPRANCLSHTIFYSHVSAV